jgi:hypothetical protein
MGRHPMRRVVVKGPNQVDCLSTVGTLEPFAAWVQLISTRTHSAWPSIPPGGSTPRGRIYL